MGDRLGTPCDVVPQFFASIRKFYKDHTNKILRINCDFKEFFGYNFFFTINREIIDQYSIYKLIFLLLSI